MSDRNGKKSHKLLWGIGIFVLICFLLYPFIKDEKVEEETTVVTTFDAATDIAEATTVSKDGPAKSTDKPKSTLKTSNHKVKVKYKSNKLKLKDIPKYKVVKAPYVRVNGNKPTFTKKEIKKKSFQKFSKLDSLGRCGVAIASVGKDIMPKSKRTSISSVYPTGWHTYRYSNVAGRYLYNRCHLIGHQLTGQNANAKNLITGTRYMNVDGMLPFENEVADCVKYQNKHVMYRVRPMYKKNNLVASGVQMEAYSVEDKGRSVSFNVYCYNVQPGVKINYKTGTSKGSGKLSGSSSASNKKYKKKRGKKGKYILSLNTKKFHYTNCSYVSRIKNSNKKVFNGNRQTLINQGYSPCKGCNP